jgi:hypothetical protein
MHRRSIGGMAVHLLDGEVATARDCVMKRLAAVEATRGTIMPATPSFLTEGALSNSGAPSCVTLVYEEHQRYPRLCPRLTHTLGVEARQEETKRAIDRCSGVAALLTFSTAS